MGEHSFDIEGIEPAKAHFINEVQPDNESDEQPNGNTPGSESIPAAPVAPIEQPAPVQAPTESDDNYKNLQAAFTKVTQDNSELRNMITDLEARLVTPPAPTPQSSFDVPAQQPQKPDELDKTVEDYAELSPFATRIKQLEAQVKEQNLAMTAAQQAQINAQKQAAQQVHEQKIVAVHPDAFSIARTPEFQGWVTRQPRYIQVAVREGSAEELIDVFTAYKGTPTKVDVANQIANPFVGSAVIKNTDPNKPFFTGAQIDAMSYAEFTRRESEIQEAQRDGRVV